MTTPDLPPLRTAAEVLSDPTIEGLLHGFIDPMPPAPAVTPVSTPELTHYLLSNLGQRLSTVAVGLRDAQTLTGWRDGAAEPDELTTAKLHVAAQATALIATTFGYEPGKGCTVAIAYLRASNYEVPPGVSTAPILAIGGSLDLEVLAHVNHRVQENAWAMINGAFTGPDLSPLLTASPTSAGYDAEPMPRWLSYEYGLGARSLAATTAATLQSNTPQAQDTLLASAGAAASATATFHAFPGTRTALNAIVHLTALLDASPGAAGAAPLQQLLRDSAHDPAVRATIDTILTMVRTPDGFTALKTAVTAAWASPTPTTGTLPPAAGALQRADPNRDAHRFN